MQCRAPKSSTCRGCHVRHHWLYPPRVLEAGAFVIPKNVEVSMRFCMVALSFMWMLQMHANAVGMLLERPCVDVQCIQ